MQYKFSPSIMCSKPWDMLTYIKQFEEAGIEMIHYDVMDGHYVPNIMLGSETFKHIHNACNLAIDLHLMCSNPSDALKYFDIQENDRVSFHPQTISSSYTLLKTINELGAKSGIALNPGTPIDYITENSTYLDFVLLMSVEPGYAGQKMLPNAIDKIKRVVELRDANGLNFDIVMDGNCNADNVKKMIDAGASQFVVGSALLNENIAPEEFCKAFTDYKIDIGI